MTSHERVSCQGFLSVRPGDLVVVEEESIANKSEDNWWLGHVIHVAFGARGLHVNSLFQVADIDTGLVKTINADLVKGILRPRAQVVEA